MIIKRHHLLFQILLPIHHNSHPEEGEGEKEKKKKKKKPHPNNTPQQLQLRTLQRFRVHFWERNLQINSFISVGGGNEPRIHEEVLGGSAAIEDVDLVSLREEGRGCQKRGERGGRRKKFIIVLRGRMKVV